MKLIALHHKSKASNYIEGFSERYGCITLWNDADGLMIGGSIPFFTYTADTLVGKYTNPFRR